MKSLECGAFVSDAEVSEPDEHYNGIVANVVSV